jgi:multidrug efflux pump subunit AcrB
MSFAGWALGHRRSILLVVLIAAIAGIASSLRVPVALFPDVNFPRIVVSIDAGDRPAEQMVIQVTRIAEQAVRSVPGMTNLRSTTSRGSAELSINMAWGSNTEIAALQVDSALARVLPTLPASTRFVVRRMDPTVFPVAGYALVSQAIDQIALHQFANDRLIPILSALPGVARVDILGGKIGEFQVEIDTDQLVQMGLTVDDVANALSASNVLRAVGRVADLHKLFLTVIDDRIGTIEDIRNTIVRTGAAGIVALDDIAIVRKAPAPDWQAVTADGVPAVLVQVYQQPGGNTVQIVRDVNARLAEFKDRFPPGVELTNWYDQSYLVLAAAGSVRDAILIGAGLAALVLLAFLRNVKLTLIALLTVPAAISITILVLMVMGRSFNIMTLGGMAAATGLVIDDAIVIVEQMVRGLAERREATSAERARNAAAAFLKPFAGSSLSTVIIFVPLAFLSGVAGEFFQALSLTMVSALAVSFLIGWLAIPLVADRLLTLRDVERENRREQSRGLVERSYVSVLRLLLRVPAIAALVLAVFLGVSFVAYLHVGSGFMPPMDEGGFVLDYRAPPGTALADADALVRQVEAILHSIPEVATFSRRTGAQLGGGITETNEGDFFVRLTPLPRRPIDEIMSEVRNRVAAQVPALQIDTVLLMEDLIGDLTAVPQPVEIKIFGDDPKQLLAAGPRVAAAIAKVPGLVSVRDGIVVAGDALAIRIDRSLAQLEGLDPANVGKQVESMLSGAVPTQVTQGIDTFDVRVWLSAPRRRTLLDIERLLLRTPGGTLLPLARIAKIERVTGQPQITRENMKQMVAVTARVEGRDMGSAVADVRSVLSADPALVPSPLYYELGGLYKEQQKSFLGLTMVFGAGVGLVFMLVLFLYERFSVALTLLLVPAIGAGAVFVGLALTGTELNISALMGLTMILGIVTEVSIFFFSEYYRQRATGIAHIDALIEAGRTRFRPIAMTTVAAILALTPLALAIGQGSAMQKPLAIAIIAGLMVQMPLVLWLIPAVFHWSTRRQG